MTNQEIDQFIASLIGEFGNKLEMHHHPPVFADGGHVLDVDSPSFVGTICMRQSGEVDWQFMDRATGSEMLVGYEATRTVSELTDVVLRVLQQITRSSALILDFPPTSFPAQQS